MEGRVPFVQVLGPMSGSSNSFILSYFSPLCLFALHSGTSPPFYLATCLLKVFVSVLTCLIFQPCFVL